MTRSALLLLLLGFASCAKVWTGNGPNNLFNEPTNWNPVGTPSYNDDLQITGSAQVSLSEATKGYARSLTLGGSATLNIVGDSLYATGAIHVQDSATLSVNNGALQGSSGSFGSSSTVTFFDATVASVGTPFQLLANIAVAGTSTLSNFTIMGGTLKVVTPVGGGVSLDNVDVQPYGSIVVTQQARLFSYNGLNRGSISFQNNTSMPPAGWLQTAKYSGGPVTVDEGATAQLLGNLIVQNFQLPATSTLITGAAGGILTGAQINGQMEIGLAPSTQDFEFEGLSGKGSISIGASANVILRQGSTIGSVSCSVSSGTWQFYDSPTIGNFAPGLCVGTLNNTKVTANVLTLQESTINGLGTITAQKVTVNTATLGSTVSLLSPAVTVTGGTFLFDFVGILKGGSLSIAGAVNFNSVGGKQGTLQLQGTLTVQSAQSLTSNGIDVQGGGSVVVADSTAQINLNNGQLALGSVLLGNQGKGGVFIAGSNPAVNINQVSCGLSSTSAIQQCPAAAGTCSVCGKGRCGPLALPNNQYLRLLCQ